MNAELIHFAAELLLKNCPSPKTLKCADLKRVIPDLRHLELLFLKY